MSAIVPDASIDFNIDEPGFNSYFAFINNTITETTIGLSLTILKGSLIDAQSTSMLLVTGNKISKITSSNQQGRCTDKEKANGLIHVSRASILKIIDLEVRDFDSSVFDLAIIVSCDQDSKHVLINNLRVSNLTNL